jgi:hypothetical protein
MKNLRTITGPFSGIAVLLLLAASTAAGDMISRDVNLPISVTLPNPCTGELTYFSGSAHISSTITTNANSVHLKTHFNVQGLIGVGESSGIRYVGSEAFNEEFNASGRSHAETTVTDAFKAISQGASPNLIVHTLLHITANANGEITANFAISDLVCR